MALVQAGDRLRAFLAALPDGLLDTGVPPCAITTIDDLNVVTIAATGHLA